MSRVRVSGVVLAAGPSRRFGDDPPKQLVLIDGQPLVRRVVRQALESHLSEVIVVVGKAAAKVERVVADLPVRVVHNPLYRQGQSTSVKVGLENVEEGASGAMFVPVDQPGLAAAIIDALIDRYQQSEALIVLPTFAGRRGAPALIDRTLFPDLAGISGDTGGRQIFAAFEDRLVELPLESDLPLRDLDTPADLRDLAD